MAGVLMDRTHRWRDLPSSLRFTWGKFGKATFVTLVLGAALGAGLVLATEAILIERSVEELREATK